MANKQETAEIISLIYWLINFGERLKIFKTINPNRLRDSFKVFSKASFLIFLFRLDSAWRVQYNF